MNKDLINYMTLKRQEYLRKKAGYYTGVGFSICLIVLFLYGATGLVDWVKTIAMLHGSTNKYVLRTVAKAGEALIYTVPFMLAGMVGGCVLLRGSIKGAKSLPVVLPVAEQIAALLPEQILVRGSDQPTASSGELLRAATGGKVMPEKELLRPGPLEEGSRTA